MEAEQLMRSSSAEVEQEGDFSSALGTDADRPSSGANYSPEVASARAQQHVEHYREKLVCSATSRSLRCAELHVRECPLIAGQYDQQMDSAATHASSYLQSVVGQPEAFEQEPICEWFLRPSGRGTSGKLADPPLPHGASISRVASESSDTRDYSIAQVLSYRAANGPTRLQQGQPPVPWPSAVKVTSDVPTPAAPAVAPGIQTALPATPVSKGLAADDNLAHGRSSDVATLFAVRSKAAALCGGPNASERAVGCTTRAPKRYWSSSVCTGSDAAASRSRKSQTAGAAVTGLTLGGSRTKPLLPPPGVSSQAHLEAKRAAATPATAAGTASGSARAKGLVPFSEHVLTRRQSAAAALTEVVRIDDSSDEERSPPPPPERVSGPTAINALTMIQGLTPRLSEKDCLVGAQSAELQKASEGIRHPSAAYVVFAGVIVSGDGRSCLLSPETIVKAAEHSGELGRQQLNNKSGDGVAATGQTATQSRTENCRAGNSILVLQGHQDKHGYSLDLWKTRPVYADTDLDRNHVSVPGEESVEDDLFNIVKIPTASIQHSRWLNLCVLQPQQSYSRCTTSKGICRRCGRGRNHVKVRTAYEGASGRSSERKKAPDDQGREGHSSGEECRNPNAPNGERTKSKGTGEADAASSSKSDARVARKGHPAGARETSAPVTARRKPTARRRSSCDSGRLQTEPADKRSNPTDSHGRHSSSRSAKGRSSHSQSKGARSHRSDRVRSRERSHSSRGTRHVELISDEATAGHSKVSVALQVLKDEKNQPLECAITPVNALAVTDGKLVREDLQQHSESATGAALPRPKGGGHSSGCSDMPLQGVKEDGNMDNVNSTGRLPAEAPHSSKGVPFRRGGREEERQSSDLKQLSTESTSKRRLAEENPRSCSPCHEWQESSAKMETAFLESAVTTSVLCIELWGPDLEGLRRSRLLEILLRSDRGSTCASSPPSEREQQTVGKKTHSGLLVPSTLPVAPDFDESPRRSPSCNDKIVSANDCRKKSTHRSRCTSGASEHSCRRCLSGSSIKDSQRSRFQSHHHRGSPRRQPKSTGSGSKKRRRDASSSSAATTSDGNQKGVCSSASSGSSFKRERTCVSTDVSRNYETLSNSEGILPPPEHCRSGCAAPDGLPGQKQQIPTGYLQGSFSTRGSSDGFLFILCVGPPLHVSPKAIIETKVNGAGDKSLGSSEPPGVTQTLLATTHPAAGDSSSTCSGQQEAVSPLTPGNSSEKMLTLTDLLAVPSDSPAGVCRMPEEVVDVETFAKYLDRLTADQRNRSCLAGDKSSGQQILEVLPRLIKVLERLVWKGYKLCGNVRGPDGTRCNLLPTLSRSWQMRDSQGPTALVSVSGVPQKAPPTCLAMASQATGLLTKHESAVAAAARTAATPPVFDLLLDDKTLHRLSGKEFLDDTIIDFCLKFIVDHMLTPEERLRVHVCNTFFLSALMAQPSEAEVHSRLTRWLKKELTPLPRKDFIFIPVHHKDQHWSLAVVVYPWRAVNSSAGKVPGLMKKASGTPVCEKEDRASVRDALLKSPANGPSLPAGVEKARCCAIPAAKLRMSLESGRANVPGPVPSGGPHAHRASSPKAQMFHVDSMGLRAVFDGCRGRLKNFLRREFEYRCGGTLGDGESAELCTESCCWQDGNSCALHTPRQQNGYDCGVFVVEYVHFLTRNLNAIELLLSGPIREAQPCERRPPSISNFSGSHNHQKPASGHLEKGEVQTKPASHVARLERVLGFSCPCMAVGPPTQAPSGNSIPTNLASDVKRRLAELRLAKASMATTTAAQLALPQHLQRPRFHSLAPSQRGNFLFRSTEFTHQLATPPAAISVGKKFIPKVPPVQATAAEMHLAEASHEAACQEVAAAPSSGTKPLTPHSSCPAWGPLPLSFSKRRSAHTKWFSQVQVTQRRLQLHKMLLLMRQNSLWHEDPRLVAHMKSLFLGVESS
ncbi:hypothetical protein Efla_004846 [Eimeria flavescens]